MGDIHVRIIVQLWGKGHFILWQIYIKFQRVCIIAMESRILVSKVSEERPAVLHCILLCYGFPYSDQMPRVFPVVFEAAQANLMLIKLVLQMYPVWTEA